ncbi:endonuclease/exonuclease/phosphatase family protein [Paracoccus tegillarcae]|uniref:Endonuclease n=1 Tax=Paracoccus tegillarcae TaxID=1529068 RepID=A0A2K9EFQ7_9RHOB|nr:endonuclease/exonuclease/phosphatase family protein [Paracoccus tegillarcae]AUH33773.1 endonuclease [Paracoccus tegillarcae]
MGLRTAATALLLALPAAAVADTVRIATYGPDLSRKGPGLLLADIEKRDPQVLAAAAVIAHAEPDAILLTGFDWDHDGLALDGFAALISEAGLDLPHRFAGQPNSGMATGVDLDGDGRSGTADDAQGFGFFTGASGMALLSRLPLAEVRDHSAFLWRDLPGNLMPSDTPADAAAIQRLSSTAHWDVALLIDGEPLHLLAWSATPPVFDGPEDRNGRRNHDEAAFWPAHLPKAPFVLLGNLNVDPVDGDGRPEGYQALMTVAHDPKPRGAWQPPQDGANAVQNGDPALDTADWADADGPGNLRADYVLPAKDLTVLDAGVLWPDPETELGRTVQTASRHRLVWVDIRFP